jgi:hypothetical protein
VDEHRKEPIIGDDKTGAGAAAAASETSAGAGESGAGETPAVNAGGEAAASPRAESQLTASEAGKPADDSAQHQRVGQVTIMAPARKNEDWYRHWDDEIEVDAPDESREQAAKPHGARQLAAVAAAVILAAIAGAVGGALATTGLSRLGDNADSAAQAQSQARSLDEQVAKLQTELAALKTNVDRADKAATAQITKTSDRLEKATDRLDKVEKAQAEPTQKIAKLSETVEKLRVAQAEKPAPAPAQVASASQDVTGSVTPKPAAKPNDLGRLPTVEGWVLREVYDGGAVIVGREGTFEVYAGDPVPGLGRVDAIRRQDGRWVVVTNRGLIVSR